MSKFLTIFFTVLSVLVGVALFVIKAEVQGMDEDLVTTRRNIAGERSAIHALNAEWAFLRRPDRIAEMASRILRLENIPSSRVIRLEEIPLRQSPAAATPPAAAPSPEAANGAAG